MRYPDGHCQKCGEPLRVEPCPNCRALERLEDDDRTVMTDGGVDSSRSGQFHAPRDLSVPLKDAVGYLHVGVDPGCDPVEGEGYWIPVGEKKHVEERHPPQGHVIQYPKDDREPSRVGDAEVPDHVSNWDYRGDA